MCTEQQKVKYMPETSSEWLRKHGMSAKQMDIYSILRPNAYSYAKGFVPIIGRRVRSCVHERAMVQFKWCAGCRRRHSIFL